MIFPPASAVLRMISHTFDSILVPTLTEGAVRSAAATVSHLLRHVTLRIEDEGQILFDDIRELRTLLQSTRRYLRTLDPDPGAVEESNRIDGVLARRYRGEAEYPSLASLATEAGSLRECLYGNLKYLQSVRARHRGESEYAKIRAEIRRYIGWQIEQESRLIEPAFQGRGPRR